MLVSRCRRSAVLRSAGRILCSRCAGMLSTSCTPRLQRQQDQEVKGRGKKTREAVLTNSWRGTEQRRCYGVLLGTVLAPRRTGV